MTEFSAITAGLGPLDDGLRENLAQGDAQIASIAPVLRHLLANNEHSVFGDEIIARVRGMLSGLARQLLTALAPGAGGDDEGWYSDADTASLVQALCGTADLVGHVHALALEWQLTERLQIRLSVDPVVPPLLQALIASPDPAIAAAAISLLAQQARFAQGQRRMQLPLAELPGDLLHAVLAVFEDHIRVDPVTQVNMAQTLATIRKNFDESRSRLGLISRIVAGMGSGAGAALNITHAGPAIFLSALAMASGQDRHVATLSTIESQLTRLVLSLRAAGLKQHEIEEQVTALHPEGCLPDGFEQMGPDRAAALLAQSATYSAG